MCVTKSAPWGLPSLARHYGIPFYVACPYSTIDHDMESGDKIPIEERDPEEIVNWGGHRTAPDNVLVRSPAFDVTPNELVTGLITEKRDPQGPLQRIDPRNLLELIMTQQSNKKRPICNWGRRRNGKSASRSV